MLFLTKTWRGNRIFARNNAINIERDAESAMDGWHTWVPVELRQLYATNRIDFGTASIR